MSTLSTSTESTLYLIDFGTSHDPQNPLHRGRLIRASPNGSPNSFHHILQDLYLPDSIDVDESAGRLYFTCMGIPGSQDGSVHSCNYDGSDLRDVLSKGVLNTPKQIVIDSRDGWMYICDREGLRIVRCRLDGSQQVEDLVIVGNKEMVEERVDQMRWCVGIAVDREGGKLYWTMKGPNRGNKGRIFRAHLSIPDSFTAETRQDLECIIHNLPEPIALALDNSEKHLYWTDRGDPPWGNSLNCISLDQFDNKEESFSLPLQGTIFTPPPWKVLARGLHEAMGVKIDSENKRIFVTDLGGCVYCFGLSESDGVKKGKMYEDQGTYTGITLVHGRKQ